MPNPTCDIEGCEKPTRTPGSALCPMHYHRQYRHGRLDITVHESGVSVSHGRRYRRLHRPGHPLVNKYGSVYAHRFVLYEAIGPGPHPCHWCSAPIDWRPKGSPGELQPDHLNGIGDDNRIANLVPSCRSCNNGRALARRHEALKAAGWWTGHDTAARLSDPTKARPTSRRTW